MKRRLIFVIFVVILVTGFTACTEQKTLRVTIAYLQDDIVIPSNVRTLELARGPWVYVFNKEEVLKNTKFFVVSSNDPESRWGRTSDNKDPSQAYVAAFYCLPKDKQEERIPSKELLKVEILPAKEKIKGTARNIRRSAQIKVSGIHFKLLKHIKDGKEQVYPPQINLSESHLFYVTDLRVEYK
jgi:hypothetical protein